MHTPFPLSNHSSISKGLESHSPLFFWIEMNWKEIFFCKHFQILLICNPKKFHLFWSWCEVSDQPNYLLLLTSTKLLNRSYKFTEDVMISTESPLILVRRNIFRILFHFLIICFQRRLKENTGAYKKRIEGGILNCCLLDGNTLTIS